MLTDLGKVPDVLGVADYGLLPKLVVPRFASWYVVFGSNAMVLAYSKESIGAKEITSNNWWRILLRPGVRTGRSDFNVDPSVYRTLMALQLAERHYRQTGLTARLKAAMPQRYVRHAEADLSALIETGELDYAWTYRSLAEAHHLKYLTLPSKIDLSDPNLAEWYAHAQVRIPGGPGKDSLELKGEPILFAMTIPTAAPHADLAVTFVRFLLSPEGRAILRQSGFIPLRTPRFYGTPPADLPTSY
jgi:molybdate/tungstate transport system substrate-binding protein